MQIPLELLQDPLYPCWVSRVQTDLEFGRECKILNFSTSISNGYVPGYTHLLFSFAFESVPGIQRPLTTHCIPWAECRFVVSTPGIPRRTTSRAGPAYREFVSVETLCRVLCWNGNDLPACVLDF